MELHSYDPDNTQRKTVASSNNGVQAQQKERERGKRMKGGEQGKGAGRKKRRE